MFTGNFPLVLIGGRAEGLACADPGARTPIGMSGNSVGFRVVASLILSVLADGVDCH